MNIGFASIYSARPAPHFMAYLASLASEAGARTFVLTCDGAAGTCSNHLIRDRNATLECALCVAGGLRSFSLGAVTRLKAGSSDLTGEAARELAYSSAITLSREEATEAFSGPMVLGLQDRLEPGVKTAYHSAREWIRANHLDAVFVYNGRMDMTAAICQASRDENIRFVTVERSSLVGHGIWLVPDESCLSLHEFNAMVDCYRVKPLNGRQATLAARILAQKLARRTDLEWRVYNRNAIETAWPKTGGGRRVLILPSSRNELEGNREWDSELVDLEKTLPRFFDKMGIKPGDCLVRGHPLWAERVGRVAQSPANDLWRAICGRLSLTYIPSESRASTQSLIQQADMIVLNASFAAIEAGSLGKQIICFGHSHYERAGLATMISTEADWAKLEQLPPHDPVAVIQATLRFVYTIGWRFPQFVSFVRGVSSTDYVFRPGGSAARLVALVQSGRLVPDDEQVAANDAEEAPVIAEFHAGRGAEFARDSAPEPEAASVIKRRLIFRLVDPVRRLMPKGDA